jgi:hypothetical protein
MFEMPHMGRLPADQEDTLKDLSSKWIGNTLKKKPFSKTVIRTFIDKLYLGKGLRKPEMVSGAYHSSNTFQ